MKDGTAGQPGLSSVFSDPVNPINGKEVPHVTSQNGGRLSQPIIANLLKAGQAIQ
ncbi:hypothetical protein Scep_028036 [Stephania cephalantha]|uniref:Uncharacterized protein n=1 Tax=Stephania cephalantha TaxID=152367 RepID=A0AAP0E954_9MAGN